MANSLQVGVISDMMKAAGEALIENGFDREAVARGTLLAALQIAHPLVDLPGQAKWLRDMAQGIELATLPTESMAAS